MGTEMTVAAAAMATIIVDPKNLSRMIGSPCLAGSYSNRIPPMNPNWCLMVAIFSFGR
jgi:hypothetical protein